MISSIINKIELEIANHSNIYGVALNFDYGTASSKTTFTEIDKHLMVSDTGTDSITRTTLFVQNKFFNLTLSDSTKQKLRSSLINFNKS